MISLVPFVLLISLQSNVKGYQCNYNWQCPSSFFHCNQNLQLCVCNPSHPVRLRNSCLPALHYGEPCEFSDSCRFYDINTFCHRTKGCVCKEGFRPYNQHLFNKCAPKDRQIYSNWPYDDDDSGESGEDDDDDDVTNNVAAPIIVGIVLGSAIVCGWSCAICRVYLKKMEKQRARTRQRRIRRFKMNQPANRPIDSELEFPIETLIISNQANEMPLLNESNRHSCVATIVPVHEKSLQSNRRSLPGNFSSASVPLHLCPDEEPLPGYEGSQKGSTEYEIELLPPSYDEVMKENRE